MTVNADEQTEVLFSHPSLLHAFEARARNTPEARAVCGPDGSWLTMADLNAWAETIGDGLRALGAKAGDRIALAQRRSPIAVATILGAWKLGAVYVPLDRNAPDAFQRFVIEDCGAKLVVGAPGETVGALPEGCQAFEPPAAPVDVVAADDRGPRSPQLTEEAAWILYTSGSTGRPKGVIGSHRGSLNRCRWIWRHHPYQDGEVAVQNTALTVVDSIWEIWGPLAQGVPVLVPAPDASLDPPGLIGTLADFGVTRLCLVPSLLRVLLDTVKDLGTHVPQLHTWICSGEPMEEGLALRFRKIVPYGILFNQYGLTESCADVTAFDTRQLIEGEANPARIVSVGAPIDGVDLRIVDGGGQSIPQGDIGELWLSGEALALGYVGLPELTAQRFVSVEEDGRVRRWLRTGDLACLDTQGRATILGRMDRQVKVRGFRVEPEGVEAALAGHPGVKAAAVTGNKGAQGRLIGYVTVRDGHEAVTGAALRDFLEQLLPAHMIPATISILPGFPLTQSGKIDYGALPEPETEISHAPITHPHTDLEHEIAELWRNHLGGGAIGVDEDFFGRGGDSLLLIRILADLLDRRGVRIAPTDFFEEPTVRGMVKLVQNAPAQAQADPLRNGAASLTQTQAMIWLQDQSSDTPGLYNLSSAFDLRGAVDADAIRAATRSVVVAQEALRTVYRANPEGAEQRIIQDPGDPFVLVDMAGADEWQIEAAARDEAHRPFDLERGPLLRVLLLSCGRQHSVLVVTAHHLACDGVSFGLILDALSTAYKAAKAGKAPELPSSSPTQWSRSGRFLPCPAAVAEPGFFSIATDNPRPKRMSGRGADLELPLDAPLLVRVEEAARSIGVSQFVFLLAALMRSAQAHSGETRVTIRIPLAERFVGEDETIVGCLMRLVPITVDLADDPSFLSVAKRVQAALWQAHAVKDSGEDTYGESSGLIFAFDDLHEDALDLEGIDVSWRSQPRQASISDIFLTINRLGERRILRAEYATDLFRAATIRDFVTHFLTAAGAAASAPQTSCLELPVMTAEEETRLLEMCAGPERVDYPLDRTLDELIAEQIGRTPDSVVAFNGAKQTHKELLASADRLAVALQQRGVNAEDVVAVHIDRSFDMIIAILGVLRAGAAYLPLEPEQPVDRLQQFVEDASAALIVADEAHLPVWSGRNVAPTILVGDLCAEARKGARPKALSSSDSRAYVIFTSGSTGRPKGVAVTHKSIVNELSWMQETYRLGPQDCYLHKTSIGFDVSIWGIFLPFMSGAKMEIALPGGHTDMAYLVSQIDKAGVTVLDFVPSVLQLFVEHVERFPCSRVRKLFAIGEALPEALAARARACAADEVHNLYGPTEAAVHVTWRHCASETGAATAPIGNPIANTQAYVLDKAGKLTPPGVPGELVLGGIQIALGYVGRPKLTAERFPADHIRGSGHLYMTGDIARWRQDGQLDYLGRRDRQVKVSGLRLEPAEIEFLLRGHCDISDAFVTPRTVAGQTRLIAYLIPEAGHIPEEEELRAFMKAKLPIAAVPSAFIALGTFPRLPNGKVDINALPEPAIAEVASDPPEGLDGCPADKTRANMLRVLSEAVGGAVREGMSFIQCGGDSFGAMRAAVGFQRVFSLSILPHSLLKADSLGAFLDQIEEGRKNWEPRFQIGADSNRRDEPTSLQQERWFSLADYGVVDLYCEITGPLCLDLLAAAGESLARRHRILSSVFEPGEPPRQVIIETGNPVACTDLRGRPAAEQGEAIAAALRRCKTPFDIMREPPVALEALQLEDERTLLLGRLHHIATDGWSNSLLLDDLEDAYTEMERSGTDERPPPPQYAAFARAQRDFLSDREADPIRNWWRSQFDGSAGPTRLPRRSSKPEPGHPDRASFIVETVIPAERRRIQDAAKARNGTIFTALLGAFAMLMRDATGESDVVFGTSLAGRHQPGEEKILGVFVNPLPVRVRLGSGSELAEIFDMIRDDLADLFKYQDYALLPLLREIPTLSGLGLNDVFDAHIVFQNYPTPVTSGPRQYRVIDPQDGNISKLWGHPLGESRIMRPLDLVAFDRADGSLSLNFGFKPALLDEAAVRSWVRKFLMRIKSFEKEFSSGK